MNFRGKLLLLLLWPLLLVPSPVRGQLPQYKGLPDLAVEKFLNQEALRTDIAFLSGPFCQGRGASQPGLVPAPVREPDPNALLRARGLK